VTRTSKREFAPRRALTASVEDVERYAKEQMARYGLIKFGWTFEWNRRTTEFGRCNHRYKVIQLSRPLVRLNTLDSAKGTVLHEIAHALAGWQAKHGPDWISMCRLVGVEPQVKKQGIGPKSRWTGTCPTCHKNAYRAKPVRAWCRACARKLKATDERTQIQWRLTDGADFIRPKDV
jgi:predicted SprT family Zn-dependent metalloprotease